MVGHTAIVHVQAARCDGRCWYGLVCWVRGLVGSWLWSTKYCEEWVYSLDGSGGGGGWRVEGG